ncbi:hypothetical protein CXB51_030468 [Gossypium anomalum]|uniref:Uncharacterized protein n=1 Tax=Gossypium anomalum TaxID=47600 RepID=A0A8J5YWJ4_9ROSI|nr:hypothetical protein CXB51_030468 [Gossypium anomalum]
MSSKKSCASFIISEEHHPFTRTVYVLLSGTSHFLIILRINAYAPWNIFISQSRMRIRINAYAPWNIFTSQSKSYASFIFPEEHHPFTRTVYVLLSGTSPFLIILRINAYAP